MSSALFTVEQASQHLALHPKTVLRYIREGRLKASRIGKSYRILGSDLDTLAGIVRGTLETSSDARTTCVTDLSDMTVEAAERTATFLQAAALTGDADTPLLQLQTVYDPSARLLKVIAIGSPIDVARLLDLLHLHRTART